MFKQAVLPDTLRAIQLVSNVPMVRRAYLAGGTALALRMGHRISVDLDFFTQEKFDESLVAADLKKIGLNKESTAWMTVKGKFGKTDFSMFYYEYPLIEPRDKFEGIEILGKKDIAAMKIHALSSRGTKRDFVDTYFLSREYLLDEILGFYEQKYKDLEEKRYHIIRSLDYFADADNDMRKLEMLVDFDWQEARRFFHSEAMRLAKSELGL